MSGRLKNDLVQSGGLRVGLRLGGGGGGGFPVHHGLTLPYLSDSRRRSLELTLTPFTTLSLSLLLVLLSFAASGLFCSSFWTFDPFFSFFDVLVRPFITLFAFIPFQPSQIFTTHLPSPSSTRSLVDVHKRELHF